MRKGGKWLQRSVEKIASQLAKLMFKGLCSCDLGDNIGTDASLEEKETPRVLIENFNMQLFSHSKLGKRGVRPDIPVDEMIHQRTDQNERWRHGLRLLS